MKRLLHAAIAVLVSFAPVAVDAAVTDRDGFITSANWLVLGPFRQPTGCGRDDAELLANFIAPAAVPCEYPAAGDEIEYDPFLAESFDYAGPSGDNFLPVWRPFDDGEDDATVDLWGDRVWDCAGADGEECGFLVSWIATYVINDGDEPEEVDLCLGHDDGGQVWIDDRLVHNHSGCRVGGRCAERIPVTLAPGPHRIAVGVFLGEASGWTASLAIERQGRRLRDGDAGWRFTGVERPVLDPPACPPLPSPVKLSSCELDDRGGIVVAWENPAGAAAAQSISIRVDGREVATVAGDRAGVLVPPEEIGDGPAVTVCVVNESGFPACCLVRLSAAPLIESCTREADGSVDVRWRNPAGGALDLPIAIVIGGVEVAVLPGDAESATIAAGDLPGPPTEVCVVRGGERSCCNPLATTADGRITTRNWLLLGPFMMRRPITCQGRDVDEDLLAEFIFPTRIACEYPEEGDTIEYDAALAATVEYVGPSAAGDRVPAWRPLEDGSPDDGDNDLAADPLAPGPIEGAMRWLATYIEYRGASPADVELCIGADDGVQVWLDDDMVFNRNECGSAEYCEFQTGVELAPGPHRIAVGVFNALQGSEMSLALRRGGEAIVDDPVGFPDWVFHGAAPPPGRFPCDDGGPRFIRGDCNGDGRVGGTVTDAVFLLNHNFGGGPAPQCLAACDANGDGVVLGSVSDAVYVLTFNFLANGRPPPPPFPGCGTSERPSDVRLGCAAPPAACGG